MKLIENLFRAWSRIFLNWVEPVEITFVVLDWRVPLSLKKFCSRHGTNFQLISCQMLLQIFLIHPTARTIFWNRVLYPAPKSKIKESLFTKNAPKSRSNRFLQLDELEKSEVIVGMKLIENLLNAWSRIWKYGLEVLHFGEKIQFGVIPHRVKKIRFKRSTYFQLISCQLLLQIFLIHLTAKTYSTSIWMHF